jgi:hypothetical protein
VRLCNSSQDLNAEDEGSNTLNTLTNQNIINNQTQSLQHLNGKLSQDHSHNTELQLHGALLARCLLRFLSSGKEEIFWAATRNDEDITALPNTLGGLRDTLQEPETINEKLKAKVAKSLLFRMRINREASGSNGRAQTKMLHDCCCSRDTEAYIRQAMNLLILL